MTDLIMTAAQTYMQHPHLAAATTAPAEVAKTITEEIVPWSYYMYSVLAAIIVGAVTGVTGYFVGKRGLTQTAADLSAIKTGITNVPAEVSKVTTEVKTAL